MKGPHTLKDLVKPGDYMVEVDLKDAYFAMPVRAEHRKFLRFQFEKKTLESTVSPLASRQLPGSLPRF